MQSDGDREKERQEQDNRIKERLAEIKTIYLVMSGKGGVGKSTVAINLAVSLARQGFKTGLMDTDIHGPNTLKMLGMEGQRLQSDGEGIIPLAYNDNLSVISIASMLDNADSAVIWRGPMKIGVIKQFLADVAWGPLDYLIIDSPPGTGDEPLTVAQVMPKARGIIVTTPQDVSLMDIRKSITFCRQVNMQITGVIENMSVLVCPHCGKEIDLFKAGGGKQTALKMGVPFLGDLPLDPQVVHASDEGKPFVLQSGGTKWEQAFRAMVVKLTDTTPEKPAVKATAKLKHTGGTMKIAIPLAGGTLSAHFGHCEQFALIETDGKNIVAEEMMTPPAHEPGVLPQWLHEQGANMIIAGGMGQRAQQLFAQAGIQVVCGAGALAPRELVKKYLDGTLVTGDNICDH